MLCFTNEEGGTESPRWFYGESGVVVSLRLVPVIRPEGKVMGKVRQEGPIRDVEKKTK